MKEGWKYKPLGEVCDIYNGNSINSDYKKTHYFGAKSGYPFIATKDVSTIGVINYNNGVRIPNYDEFKVAPPDSVFICAEGGSAGKKFAYVEQNVCFGNKLFCLSPCKSTIRGKFIFYFIQSSFFKEQFYSQLTGLIGGVSAKKFKEINISFPDIHEQQRIVEYLDKAFEHIDSLKDNAQKQLDEARKLFQAALTEAMQPKEGWKSMKFPELIQLKSGDNLSAKKFTSGHYPVYGGNGITGYHNLYNRKGDTIIIGRVGALCGNARLIENSFWLTDNGFEVIIKNNYEINLKFLVNYLNFLNLRQYARQSAQPVISNSSLKGVELLIPTMIEQQKIVNQLNVLSIYIKKLEEINLKTIAECDALKQSILRQIFE